MRRESRARSRQHTIGQSRNKLPLKKKIFRNKTYKKSYLGLNAGKSTTLDISPIARLIQSFMTTEIIILNWASHKLDLQLLCGLFATAGYQ